MTEARTSATSATDGRGGPNAEGIAVEDRSGRRQPRRASSALHDPRSYVDLARFHSGLCFCRRGAVWLAFERVPD